MSFDPIKPTIIGNLVTKPEYRAIPNSKVELASFRVAVDLGYFDKQTGEDVKTGTLFFECSAKGKRGQNILASNLPTGTRVIVTGNLSAKPYVRQDGTADPGLKISVEEFGLSPLFTEVQVPARENRGEGYDWSQPPRDDMPPRQRAGHQATRQATQDEGYSYDASGGWPTAEPGRGGR